MLGVPLYVCGHFVCVCLQGVCEATVVCTHVLILDFVFLCVFAVHTLVPLCKCVCLCVCVLPDLCYSLSIVKESVEQDPDPPAGTNQTHSSGLNGQLTIREPL